MGMANEVLAPRGPPPSEQADQPKVVASGHRGDHGAGGRSWAHARPAGRALTNALPVVQLARQIALRPSPAGGPPRRGAPPQTEPRFAPVC